MDGSLDVIITDVVLLDDLDDPAGTWFDQNRAAIHNRVAIIPCAVFRRHVVIGHAVFGQNGADADVFTIFIGRVPPLDDIIVKAGAVIDAENAAHSTNHAANDTADHGAERTGGSFAISRSSFDPTGDPLRLRHDRKRDGGDKCSNSDKSADHDISYGLR
jgi:hypothetical protein